METQANLFSLENLLNPLDMDSFLVDYQYKKSVYIPGNEEKFGDLFGWEDVNHLLNFNRGSYEGLRLVYEKQNLPATELANISQWLSKGATLVVNSVDQVDPIVNFCASSLSNDLNRYININSYASCPTKQGFDTHYDRHDVFVIATEGEKTWKVFDPTYLFPLEKQTFDKGPPPNIEPYLVCTMSPGDVLYIPRGHWHYAVAESPSVHLTIGPHSCSGVDFLTWFADVIMGQEEFLRRDFPVSDIELFGGNRSNDEFDQFVDQFRTKIIGIMDDRAKLREFIVQYVISTIRERRMYRLPEISLLNDSIAPDTEFEMKSNQKFVARYDPDEKRAVIMIKGHVLDLNDVSSKIVEAFIHCEGRLTGKKLMDADSSVDWETVKAFLLLLVDRGVLSPRSSN